MPSRPDSNNKIETMPPMGLAFEVEFVLFASRRRIFDAAQKVLGDKGIVVTHERFISHGLHPFLSKAIPRIIAAHDKRLSPDKLTAETDRVYRKAMLAESTKPDTAMAELIQKAQASGARLGAVTFLAEDEARALIARANLQEPIALHVCKEIGRETPRADCWLRLAKDMGCSARQILTLVSADSAARSAAIAGTRVIAVPDAFTAHRDFTGAELVLEESQKLTWTELAACLRPCAFR